MTKYGSQFSATDNRARASGTSHNAAVRALTNYFDLAVDGNTAEALKVAELGPGCVVKRWTIETDANLSAVNFQLGIAGTLGKYGGAAAGPNATTQERYPPVSLGLTPNAVGEELLLSPSGAIPAAGKVRVTVYVMHR